MPFQGIIFKNFPGRGTAPPQVLASPVGKGNSPHGTLIGA